MSQKFGDFLFGHFSRMPLAVIDNEPLNPVDVSLLSADAVMFASDDVPVCPRAAFSIFSLA